MNHQNLESIYRYQKIIPLEGETAILADGFQTSTFQIFPDYLNLSKSVLTFAPIWGLQAPGPTGTFLQVYNDVLSVVNRIRLVSKDNKVLADIHDVALAEAD